MVRPPQSTKEAVMAIEKLGFVNTPDDWEAIEAWIDKHPREDRVHLWVAAGMAWNLAIQQSTNKETINA